MSLTDSTTPAQAIQIGREHHELRRLIDSIAERLENEPERADEVAPEFAALAERLVAHFASEEAGDGFYAQVLEQDARFGPEIARLTEEHAVLLELLRSLTSEATPAAELPGAFERFRQMLGLHEGDENRLMQQAYTDEIGSKD